MIPKRLEDQFKRALEYYIRKGYDIKEIRNELLRHDYPEDVADQLIEKYAPKKKIIFPHLTNLIVIVFIVLIIVVVLALILPFKIGKCSTEECFIEAADNCKTSYMEKEIESSLFSYSTENCVLTKKAVKVNEDEPTEVKDLLEGKSMECSYEKDNFDIYLIDTLTIGIENCSGDLKDALEELLIL